MEKDLKKIHFSEFNAQNYFKLKYLIQCNKRIATTVTKDLAK